MKFEGDLTRIMVTGDFFGTATVTIQSNASLRATATLFALTRQKKMAVVWMAVMVWVAKAEGWC